MNAAAVGGRQDLVIAADTPLAELCAWLKRRHDGVIGCIVYGSCLRSGEVLQGLCDVYLIVDGYARAHGSRRAAFFNWLLPPNVYYAEVPITGGMARVKYSILTLADLERGCSKWFESYVWGRFAQPVGLFGLSEQTSAARLREALMSAARRLIDESLPLVASEFTSRELITAGLSRSYASELRAEKPGRVIEIFDYAPEHYQALCNARLEALDHVQRIEQDRWRSSLAPRARLVGRGRWLLRRVSGKLTSLMRLVKAYFTFRDGIDYLAWKLSRHSRQDIEVPERVRRFPLIFGWAFFLRLYRRGVFK